MNLKTSSILFFLLFQFTLLFAQEVVNIKLLSSTDNSPVPFAVLLDITSEKYSTTTNEEGEARIKYDKSDPSIEFYISSIGYKDSTITLSQIINSKTKVIYLSEEIIELNELVVTPDKKKSRELMTIGVPLDSKVNCEASLSIDKNNFFGVYVKKQKKEGILEAINFHVSEDGFPKSQFLVRIMIPHDTVKVKPFRMIPIESFNDLLPEVLIGSPQGPGWYKLDLSRYQLSLPNRDFFVVVFILDQGDEFYWTDRNGNRSYGISFCGSNLAKKELLQAGGEKHRLWALGDIESLVERGQRIPAISIEYYQ